jgi:hypothetical protein
MYKEKSAGERKILWNKEISVIEQSLFCFSYIYIWVNPPEIASRSGDLVRFWWNFQGL